MNPVKAVQIPASELYSGEDALSTRECEYCIECYDGNFYGDTIENAAQQFARSFCPLDNPIMNITVTIRATLVPNKEAISRYVKSLHEQHLAELERRRLAEVQSAVMAKYQEQYESWLLEINTLNAEHADYTPDAYNRRYDAIMARKPKPV